MFFFDSAHEKFLEGRLLAIAQELDKRDDKITRLKKRLEETHEEIMQLMMGNDKIRGRWQPIQLITSRLEPPTAALVKELRNIRTTEYEIIKELAKNSSTDTEYLYKVLRELQERVDTKSKEVLQLFVNFSKEWQVFRRELERYETLGVLPFADEF